MQTEKGQLGENKNTYSKDIVSNTNFRMVKYYLGDQLINLSAVLRPSREYFM